MKNRNGTEYEFVSVGTVSDGTYTIVGDLDYWRYGGREGQDGIDYSDLGFVDPSGGPFIGLGSIIQGRKIVNISIGEGDKIYFKTGE